MVQIRFLSVPRADDNGILEIMSLHDLIEIKVLFKMKA